MFRHFVSPIPCPAGLFLFPAGFFRHRDTGHRPHYNHGAGRLAFGNITHATRPARSPTFWRGFLFARRKPGDTSQLSAL